MQHNVAAALMGADSIASYVPHSMLNATYCGCRSRRVLTRNSLHAPLPL